MAFFEAFGKGVFEAAQGIAAEIERGDLGRKIHHAGQGLRTEIETGELGRKIHDAHQGFQGFKAEVESGELARKIHDVGQGIKAEIESGELGRKIADTAQGIKADLEPKVQGTVQYMKEHPQEAAIAATAARGVVAMVAPGFLVSTAMSLISFAVWVPISGSAGTPRHDNMGCFHTPTPKRAGLTGYGYRVAKGIVRTTGVALVATAVTAGIMGFFHRTEGQHTEEEEDDDEKGE